jgi:hypothetical protein
LTEDALDDIEDAFRITTQEAPILCSPPLEEDFLPGPARIIARVRQRMGVGPDAGARPADTLAFLQANSAEAVAEAIPYRSAGC